MTVRRRSDAKRGVELEEKISEKAEELEWESAATKPDASTDRPPRARVPNRRLTEQELRELLNAKQRELAERQRHEEEERQLGLGNAEPREPDIKTNDTGIANERESANTAVRDFDEAKSRRTERKKPLAEQELSEILSHGVQRLNEADKWRKIDGRDRDPNFGIGFD